MRAPRHPLLLILNLFRDEAVPYSPPERWVAVAIAAHMDDSGSAWPSVRQLRGMTGLGETAVREAVARLCEGEAPLFERTVGGARAGARYQSSHYTLRVDAQGVATRGARETRGSSGDAEGVATRGRGGRHATTEEPREEPREEPIVPVAGSARKPKTDNSALKASWLTPYFDAWVEQYGGKPNAGRLARALAELRDDPRTLVRWKNYLISTPPRYAKPEAFASTAGSWDQPEPGDGRGQAPARMTANERTMAAVARFVAGEGDQG